MRTLLLAVLLAHLSDATLLKICIDLILVMGCLIGFFFGRNSKGDSK